MNAIDRLTAWQTGEPRVDVGYTAGSKQFAADVIELLASRDAMLDMLKTIENDSGQVPDWLWDQIQKVISKAEGRT